MDLSVDAVYYVSMGRCSTQLTVIDDYPFNRILTKFAW
jgi:hypothetical protein